MEIIIVIIGKCSIVKYLVVYVLYIISIEIYKNSIILLIRFSNCTSYN